MSALTVVVIDDQQLVADAIKSLLEAPENASRFRVVATAFSGPDGLEAVHHYVPDLVLVDQMMPEMDGIEVISRLRAAGRKGKIVVLSGFNHVDQVESALEAGADGYFVKSADRETFVRGIERVMSQSEAVVMLEATQVDCSLSEIHLSKREMQVLTMLSQGYTNSEMASLINLSKRTIEKYRASLSEKFQTHSVSVLLKRARAEGFLA